MLERDPQNLTGLLNLLYLARFLSRFDDQVDTLYARARRIEALRSDIAALDGQIKTASDPQARASLDARKSALQSEVAFLIKLRDALQKVGGLLAAPGSNPHATTLAGQIDSSDIRFSGERQIPTDPGKSASYQGEELTSQKRSR